jgi:hypothetical protein
VGEGCSREAAPYPDLRALMAAAVEGEIGRAVVPEPPDPNARTGARYSALRTLTISSAFNDLSTRVGRIGSNTRYMRL